jgi:hypothetical protein
VALPKFARLSWRNEIVLAGSNGLRRLRAYDRVLLIMMPDRVPPLPRGVGLTIPTP